MPYQAWGDNPLYRLSERFGSLNADYDPYYQGPCPLIEFDCPYIIYAADRSVIDTLFPAGEEPDIPGLLEEQLKTADAFYNDGEYIPAEDAYTGGNK